MMPQPLGYLDIPIRDIVVGDRIREDYGGADLKRLQLSIELNGVLDPLIVDKNEIEDKYNLINGGRRLHCLKKMHAKTAPCRIFDTLDIDQRREIELELCIKQKNLTYAEEARAVRDIVARREKQNASGLHSTFGNTLRKKDIATELGMSPAALSQCLTIAKYMDEYPNLELEYTSKRKALNAISSGRLMTPSATVAKQAFEDSFRHTTSLDLVKSLQGKIVDLFILHPTTVDRELVRECYARLKNGGSMILFIDLPDLGTWIPFLKSLDLYVHEQPYMWSVQGEGRYISYMWAGKNRDQPMRLLSHMLTCPRAVGALSLKAKARELIIRLIKSCTERGGLVVVPDCYDIETLKVCYDLQVNILASCPDSIIRDRLLMNCER